jgi:hypothetical protein
MIKDNFFLLATCQQFNPGMGFVPYHQVTYTKGDLLWKGGYTSYGIGAGQYINKRKLQVGVSLQFIYAINSYGGDRQIFWMYASDPVASSKPFPRSVEYIDHYGFGVSPGAEINYFFYKNIGLGCNFNLQYYPFATSRPYDMNVADASEIEQYNQPTKAIFSSNIKVVYRFRDPRFMR